MERQAKYLILETRALAALAAQDAPDSEHEMLVSYVSVMPSFENYSAWTVFSNPAETEYMAQRITWDRLFDGSRFRDPFMGLKYGWGTRPKLGSIIESLRYGKTVAHLKEAKALKFSEMSSKRPITLDGTRWHVFVSGAFGDQPQRWNWEPPEWEAMIAWTRHWVDFLDSHFEATQ